MFFDKIRFNACLTTGFPDALCIFDEMELTFYKYQGTGNDFIMIDNRDGAFNKQDTNLINKLCDRRFGIGADGLILLENDKNSDFRMVYFNSDGNESSMCGNGGRCIVAFAKMLGIVEASTEFEAVDGMHHASAEDDGTISLQMKDVDYVHFSENYIFLDTGSPHHVQMVNGLEGMDVKAEGSKIRYSGLYGEKGSNINFVSRISDDTFAVRTYERGVEDETLSCGTGVTAVAIAMHASGQTSQKKVRLHSPGGVLWVSFDENDGTYINVRLIGPADFVFKGTVNL